MTKETKVVKKAIAKKPKKKTISIQLIKSIYGRLPSHHATVIGLGLKKIGQIVELEDTQAIRGMINKVSYLLKEH